MTAETSPSSQRLPAILQWTGTGRLLVFALAGWALRLMPDAVFDRLARRVVE